MQVYQLSRQNQYNEARASEVDTMGREKSFASGTRYQAGEQKKRDVKKFFGYGEFILVKSSRRCYGPEETPTIESNLGGGGEGEGNFNYCLLETIKELDLSGMTTL